LQASSWSDTLGQRWASAIVACTSAIPQYFGPTNRLRNCGLEKVVELQLRTFKIGLPQFNNSQLLIFCNIFIVNKLPFTGKTIEKTV
jgi:hypothetical protein